MASAVSALYSHWSSAVWPFSLPDNNSTGSRYCEGENHLKDVLSTSTLCSAASLVFLFNLLQILKGWKVSLSNFLHVAVPVDFFSATPYRLIYCTILSSLAADIFNDALNPDLYYRSNNGLLDSFLYFIVTPTVIFLRQALLYFPLLACVRTRLPVLGHFLGLLYTLLMGARSVYAETVILRGCSQRGDLITRDVVILVCIALPSFVSYLIIIFWFYYRAFKEITYVLLSRKKYIEFISDDCHTSYVRQLLNKSQPRRKKSFPLPRHRKSLYQNLMDGLTYVLPWRSNPHVHFPLPFLAAQSMAYTVLFQLCIWLLWQEEVAMSKARRFVNEFNITVDLLKTLMPSQAGVIDNVFYDAKSYVLSFQVLFPLAHWTGWILTVFFTLYSVQNFHKHLLRAAHGDLAFLVASEPLPSPATQLASGMRYISFQFGHTIFSFLLYSLIVLILGVIGLVYYYSFKNHTFYAIHYWCIFMVPYMWAFALHTVQLLLSRYVFLKRTEHGSEITTSIRFRRLYLFCTYLFLGFNVIYSMAMCFLRVFGALVFNIVMLFRLDRDIYMRGLEGWDLGHRTYVGYFYLECTINNAILRTFVDLLHQTRRVRHHRRHKWAWLRSETPVMHVQISRATSDVSVTSTESAASVNNHIQSRAMILPPGGRSRLARNRWHVAYTLLRNRSLRQLTANQLSHVNPTIP